MNNRIFHLLNRGVDKRDIYLDEQDKIRFVHNMNDLNISKNVEKSYYHRKKEYFTEVAPPYDKDKEELVDILCWTLLNNHYHLLVVGKDEIENVVSSFSRKISLGHTSSFNEKYDRSGVLFQSRTKIKPVESEAYFMYIPFYIHLNTLDEIRPGWREKGIKDVKKAIEEAINFRWSNLRDIVGEGNGEFAHITNKELFFEMFDTSEKQYKKDFEDWIKSKEYENVDFDDFE